MFDVSNRQSWFRYVKDEVTRNRIGIMQEAHQTFRLRSHTSERIVRSMLSIYELGLLYALAKDHWMGHGSIVDAGPLLGASSFALAKGVYDNTYAPPSSKSASLYSFDLFRGVGYEKFVGPVCDHTITDSLLYEFNRINADYLDIIVPHQGDLLSWQ